MYEYTRSPYTTNRLTDYGLGAAPGSLDFMKVMGYWGNKALRMTTKGFNNKRPSGSGLWVWFPTQAQALNYAAGAPPPPIVNKPPDVVPPPVVNKPPNGKPVVPPPPVVVPPPIDNSSAQYRIEGNVAIPLNDLARSKPPAQNLDSRPSFMWTRRVGDGAWLWKYVPPPESVYIEPTPFTPGASTLSPANPVVKWYNNATGEIKEARLLNPPDNSGSWILGSSAVNQGLISAGALYGVYAPGGGVTAPVTGGGAIMPAYDTNGGAQTEQAGMPTWAWLLIGGAALFFLVGMKKKG